MSHPADLASRVLACQMRWAALHALQVTYHISSEVFCASVHQRECVPSQEKDGSERVCYAAANDEQFAFVRKLARDAKLATFAVVEKGQPVVQTVMAVGPVPADMLSTMTSSLHAPLQAHRLS